MGKKKKLAAKISEIHSINTYYLLNDKINLNENEMPLYKLSKKTIKEKNYSDLKEMYKELKKQQEFLIYFNNLMKSFAEKNVEEFKEYLISYRASLIRGDFIAFVQTSFSIIEGYINLVLGYDGTRHISFANRWDDFINLNRESLFRRVSELQYSKIKEYYRDPRNPIDHGSLRFLKTKTIFDNIISVLYELLTINYESLEGYRIQLVSRQN